MGDRASLQIIREGSNKAARPTVYKVAAHSGEGSRPQGVVGSNQGYADPLLLVLL